ncbi:MAG TPA: DUF4382 domain-containing protein [Rhodoferax sp.]
MKLLQSSKLALGGVLVAGLAACGGGGGGGSGSGSADNGSLHLALTDAPACGYDAVNVTIQKIRVNQSGSASDTDGGWSEIVLNPARRVDLLSLSNGVLYDLGQMPLPTGKYTQLRLVLADNKTSPMANSAVLTSDKREVELKTPSGQQSGIKTNINIDIAANQLADFVLDFNACKSVVVAGNSGQYLLKPQLSVIPRYVSGVTGFVNAGLANGFTSVSLQQNGVIIKATAPSIDPVNFGKFMLPVAPGNYSLVLTAPGRTTAVVTNVAVVADTVTAVNASGTALNPAASASATVTGTAPVDTLVRVLQPLPSTLLGGAFTTVEVAGRFVDGDTGLYTYPLAVNAPLVAPYVAAPGALVFTPDAAAAGKYTLNASLTGKVDQTTVLPALTSGATVTTNLTFP